jgi:hypothetical protein
MDGGHIMVVLIVAIVMIAGVMRAKYGHDRRLKQGEATADSGEARLLREEVARLKERVQTLERITVEKENSLAREIEDLRTRP